MPKTALVSTDYDGEDFMTTRRDFDYCVDQTSAILQSGVHYGDTRETLDEWDSPVTIIGSHDCELLFFEPMISWRWISNK